MGKKKISNTTVAARPKSTPKKRPADNEIVEEKGRFLVAGIGASAGGLEAFTDLLKHLPTDTGMAFILVQHLHPEYPSALTEILSRATSMPVTEVADGTLVCPDHVYVIPPNYYMGILHGVLHLMPRSDFRGQNLPIDYFFQHLAQDLGSMAIGVILSGTASDGVLGLKAIAAEGGITIAQDEKSAKYDGMPHSAISTGCVDFILPPDKIAVELTRIARHPYAVPKQEGSFAPDFSDDETLLNKIFLLLRRQTGNDFTYYKPTTIQRRIRRRMVLHKLERLTDYVRYLQGNTAEIEQLFHDVLINVTSFFRDPDAFVALKDKVFPLLKERSPDIPIRIWVPGCSSGEEPYSLAIALLEYLGDSSVNIPIQIFATDIDETAIAKARTGIYPESIKQDVAQERLQRFFIKMDGGGYQISKYIRDMCVFAVQNVVKDPPFSRIDLISCRNLLIYLGPVLQKKIMSIFHYSLKPDGHLLLGSAESIGSFSDYYRAVDVKEKVYTKKVAITTIPIDFGNPVSYPIVPPKELATGGINKSDQRFDLSREVEKLLMSRFAPAGVVINENMDIVQFRGRTGAYLEPPPGEASLNILKMAREDLMLELNSVIRKVLSKGDTVRKEGVKLKRDGKRHVINIEALPINAGGQTERFFLVVFDEVKSPTSIKEPESAPSSEKVHGTRITELEQELIATKEYLQSVIEQQETSNEELRSANEEIQSSNEELQSINEELETAKEELQSTNEELATVNDEMGNRNEELDRSNNDLNNLVASINIPMVILGTDLQIRRFSPQAVKLLNLIDVDIGRPFFDIKTNITVTGLSRVMSEVIDTLLPVEVEAQDNDGVWYSVKVHPYKTLDKKIDGVVIVYINVDEMKKSFDEASHARNYAEAVISSLRYPLLVLDKSLSVISASKAFYDVFKVTSEDTIGNLLYRLGNRQWGIPELRASLLKTVKTGKSFDNLIVTHEFEKIGMRTMNISGRIIPQYNESNAMVLMQIEDITEDTSG